MVVVQVNVLELVRSQRQVKVSPMLIRQYDGVSQPSQHPCQQAN